MLGLPEKISLVGGDHIQHVHQLIVFALGAEQIIAIFFERSHLQISQAFHEPALQHGLFGNRHFDAQFIRDKLAQVLEGLLGQCNAFWLFHDQNTILG